MDAKVTDCDFVRGGLQHDEMEYRRKPTPELFHDGECAPNASVHDHGVRTSLYAPVALADPFQ